MGADNVYYAAREIPGLKAVLMMEPCFNAITDFPSPSGRQYKGIPNTPEWYRTEFPFLLVNSRENLKDPNVAQMFEKHKAVVDNAADKNSIDSYAFEEGDHGMYADNALICGPFT